MTHAEAIRRAIAARLSARGPRVSWRSVRVRAVPEPHRRGWWVLLSFAPVDGAFWQLGTRRRGRRRLLATVAQAFARTAGARSVP